MHCLRKVWKLCTSELCVVCVCYVAMFCCVVLRCVMCGVNVLNVVCSEQYRLCCVCFSLCVMYFIRDL